MQTFNLSIDSDISVGSLEQAVTELLGRTEERNLKLIVHPRTFFWAVEAVMVCNKAFELLGKKIEITIETMDLPDYDSWWLQDLEKKKQIFSAGA